MTRRLPLAKRFPGKAVAKLKIWFETWSVGMEGQMHPELARLIVAVYCCAPEPEVLARLDAIARELNERAKSAESPAAPRSERALRQKLSKARAAGRIGRKS